MARLYKSYFIAIRQISRIAKTGDDIFVLVQYRVDGSAPQRDIVQRLEKLHEIVDAILSGNDAAQMQLPRDAFGAKGLIG